MMVGKPLRTAATTPHPKRPIAPNAGRRLAHRSLGSADEGDGATGASVTAPIAVAWL